MLEKYSPYQLGLQNLERVALYKFSTVTTWMEINELFTREITRLKKNWNDKIFILTTKLTKAL